MYGTGKNNINDLRKGYFNTNFPKGPGFEIIRRYKRLFIHACKFMGEENKKAFSRQKRKYTRKSTIKFHLNSKGIKV